MVDISMQDRIENKIKLDKNGVWILANSEKFNYSDGRSSELYLERCFAETKDLSSTSYELERWIKDWPSEYHLSRKRAQLLRGFDFSRSKKVLEVGCGCGAITRFLGETFDDVFAIEGSVTRARLARLRTKDMENISILNAPFQEIKFKERFDIVFCIGVFEYSNAFLAADDPYDYILKYFYDVLNINGILVIAIENQFGLKYFCSSREDHTGIKFDGIEGYPHYGNKARTFGYNDLKNRIRKYFNEIEFYFPYPDYKLPTCILSEKFFNKVRAAELIGNYRSRDYMFYDKPLFNERLVLYEIDHNGQLPFFSNSFLVIAGKRKINSIKFNSLGLIFSNNRIPEFQTVTNIFEAKDGSVWTEKKCRNQLPYLKTEKLKHVPCRENWLNVPSIQSQVLRLVKMKNISLYSLFEPCQIWISKLKDLAVQEQDCLMLDGKYLDCLWRNSHNVDGECVFRDQEWEWAERFCLNVIVIRSIFWFLDEISSMSGLTPVLRKRWTKNLIIDIAITLGIQVTKKNLKDFVRLETEISCIVSKSNPRQAQRTLNMRLWSMNAFFTIVALKRKIRTIIEKIQRRLL